MEKIIPEGYNFKGGLKVEAKPAWIKSRGLKDGKAFSLPTKATREYVNDLSCFSSVAVQGLSKRAMTWNVPTGVKLKIENVGSKKTNGGQTLPLLKLVKA